MPPKPRMVIRKPPNNVNTEQSKNATIAPHAFKTPPLPQTSNTILLPQVNALEASYKDIVVATGRVFQYYADARRERVTHYSPYPPVSIRRMLARSLEKYDQICDTIETRIQHSIAVLQRDIKELKARLKAEAEESARKPVFSPSITPPLSASPSDQSMLMDVMSGNVLPPMGGPIAPNRRQSAILSSLHRPGLPLKLDISSVTMGNSHTDAPFTTPVDVTVDLGLTRAPSPVTLAPKTAKTVTNDPALEMFINPAHHTISDIPVDAENETFDTPSNLTAPNKEVIDLTSDPATRAQLGDSADKPIELDMDTGYDGMDLFGDRSPTPRITAPNHSVQGNSSSIVPLDENLNKLLMDGATQGIENPSSSVHEGPPPQSANDPSADALRSVDENSRFNINNIDLSALFGAASGAVMPQVNATSNEDLDLMSQLLAMDGVTRTN